MPTFEREIYHSFKFTMQGAYFRRIYDKYNTGLKPFDFEVFYQGFFFAIEAKHQKGRLNLSRVHPHQKEAMEKIMRNGGFSYFIIRIEDTKKTRGKFRAFVIHYETFLKMMEEIGKKSCNAHDLESYSEYEAERGKVSKLYYGWTFHKFFEEVVSRGRNVSLKEKKAEGGMVVKGALEKKG